MQWKKLGLIWAPSGEADWARSHATLPVVQDLGDGRWWIYVSTRDAAGKSRIGRLTVDATPLAEDRPPTVISFDPTPVLSLGAPGTFDDSGMMPSWLVTRGDELWLYYIGWNVIGTVPYHVSTGLAISRDGGRTFERYSEGPVLDRGLNEPYFATTPCVLPHADGWRMWYASGTGWRQIDGRWEPSYHIKYADSDDGIAWTPSGVSCIDAGEDFAVCRPCVVQQGDGLAMWYSYRLLAGYRTDAAQAYRLGYAESRDGVTWQRLDEQAGIARSSAAWDSEMLEYCWLQQHGDLMCLLYNGNGFGRSGVGIARLAS
jgi:hypothetical protein